MNRWQKIAWFNLIIIALTLAVTTGVVTVLTVIGGMPQALYGLGFGGLIVLTLISRLLFRAKKKATGKTIFDERDEQIHRRALQASDSASLGLFLTVCMVAFFAVGLSGSVPVLMLPLMVCWAFIAGKLAESVAFLTQYGWKGKDNE